MVWLSALCTGCPYPQEMFVVLNSDRGWVDPRTIVQTEAGRIMSMKSSNDTTGNQTHNFPAFTALPLPTTSPRDPVKHCIHSRILDGKHYIQQYSRCPVWMKLPQYLTLWMKILHENNTPLKTSKITANCPKPRNSWGFKGDEDSYSGCLCSSCKRGRGSNVLVEHITFIFRVKALNNQNYLIFLLLQVPNA